MLLLFSANCSVIDAADGQRATLLLLFCIVHAVIVDKCSLLSPSSCTALCPPSHQGVSALLLTLCFSPVSGVSSLHLACCLQPCEHGSFALLTLSLHTNKKSLCSSSLGVAASAWSYSVPLLTSFGLDFRVALLLRSRPLVPGSWQFCSSSHFLHLGQE
eukprot:2626139-Rhodomonas_salina.1